MPTEPGLQAGTLVEHPEEATHPVNEKLSDKHHAEHERRMSAPLEADDSERELVEGQPTSDELHTLRRVSAPLTFSVYTVAFVELCERFSYYGTQVVYSNFVNRPLPSGTLPGANPRTGAGGSSDQGISGALGKGPQTANAINTFNSFWIYLLPLLGAYMADEHWGRYKTICICIGIAIVGHIILVISAIPPVITNTPAAFGVFMLGLIIMGLGTGGFKPNISPLVVEQIKVKGIHVDTTKKGEKVLVDPTITQSRVYHYFYLFINLGALAGQIGMVYAEKYVGFWLSFLLPTVIFFITPGIMWWGRKRYHQAPPQGSVVAKSFKLLVRATKGRWSINPIRTWKNMHDGTFWSNVKPSHVPMDQRPSWYTFDDAWVDEVRRGFAACAVFAYFPLYWLTYNQMVSNLTAQAGTMDLKGVPPDLLNNLNPITLVILIPIFDSFVYPALRRAGIRFTPIKKIFLGFILGAVAMLYAAIVQMKIYHMSPCGYQANSCYDELENPVPAPINVWVQSGAYIIIGISEIFASITSLEYAFSKAPRNMRSLVQAVALFTQAISSAIAQALNPLSADPLLIVNYGVMGGLSFVGGCFFIWQFWGLDQEEDKLNMLPEGHVIARKDVESYENEPTTADASARAQERPVVDEIKM